MGTCFILYCKFFSPVGKNAYALSVLKRVEMKLDGRDIADNRYLIPLNIFSRKINANKALYFFQRNQYCRASGIST